MPKHFNTSHFFMGLAVIAGLSISGCDKTRETFGLKRQNMDEFDVMDREPLSTPPNYRLSPPTPNAPITAVTSAQAQAKQAIAGDSTSVNAYTAQSESESSFLAKAGANGADNTIREELAREAEQEVDNDDAPGADLVFWKQSASNRKGKDVIDPVAENQKHRR